MFGVRRTLNILLSHNWSTRMRILRSIVVSSAQAPANSAVAAGSLKSFREIPGPASLPLIGPVHHFLPGGDFYKLNRQELCDELYRIYGPIVKVDRLPNHRDILFMYDAESVSKIFRSEDINWPDREPVGTLETYRQKYNRQDTMGVLVNTKGPEWKKFRTPANKVLMNPKLVWQDYSKTLDGIAKEAVVRFQRLRNENNMIPNLDEELQLWALESTVAVNLGRRLNCLSSELDENSYEKKLISLIRSVFELIEDIDFNYNSTKQVLMRVFQHNKIMQTYSELEKVLLHFVTQTLYNPERKNNSELPTSTIEKLRDNKMAALGLAMDSMFAGVDSVTHYVIFVLYMLGTNYDRQQKLREEILSGNERKPYLRACMKETSRILPVSFANARITTKPHQVHGYEIPANILIVVPHLVMCMMEKHFPRAREFIPERWLVDKEHPLYYGNAHPFAHRPFGFGIRSCIGQRFVEVTAEALLVNMIKTFDIKWVGAANPKIIPSVVTKMQPPFNLVFEKINSSSNEL